MLAAARALVQVQPARDVLDNGASAQLCNRRSGFKFDPVQPHNLCFIEVNDDPSFPHSNCIIRNSKRLGC